MTTLRLISALCGVGILAAVAYVQIIATGGFSQPNAVLVPALACGVAIGSVVLGHALAQGRTTLALFLALALLSGEAFGFLSTAERHVAAREAQQIPLRKDAEAHGDAVVRVAKAEAALAGAARTSQRLKSAEAAEAAVDAKVRESAADRGCRENCRALLQAQADAAKAEVAAARAELTQSDKSLAIELNAARAALDAHPLPASATPLADRLGIQPWALDLIAAALGAFGANGLAACLLAYAAHFHNRKAGTVELPAPVFVEIETPAPAVRPEPAQRHNTPTIPQIEDSRPTARVDFFAFEQTEPADTEAKLDLGAIHATYCAWAARCNQRALSRQEFEAMFTDLCGEVGHRVERKGRHAYVHGLKLVEAA